MPDGLDAPTVFRTGEPTLGLPILAVEYHALGHPRLPWWRRVLAWLRRDWQRTRADLLALRAALHG